MRRILHPKFTGTFIFFFLIISFRLSGQIKTSSKTSLPLSLDATIVTFLNDKMFKEHLKFKRKYICYLTKTINENTNTDLNIINNSVVDKFICALNFERITYFKSDDNTYYAIDLEADS